jgi:hypothetical protein
LHEYRGKPANLELGFNPQKLYNYLQNHYWKKGIPHEFIENWEKMEFSQVTLNEADQTNFETILEKNRGSIERNLISFSTIRH